MPEKEKHVLFQKKSASDYSETDFSLSGFTFFVLVEFLQFGLFILF